MCTQITIIVELIETHSRQNIKLIYQNLEEREGGRRGRGLSLDPLTHSIDQMMVTQPTMQTSSSPFIHTYVYMHTYRHTHTQLQTISQDLPNLVQSFVIIKNILELIYQFPIFFFVSNGSSQHACVEQYCSIIVPRRGHSCVFLEP